MKENFFLFPGSSNLPLSQEISKILKNPLGKINLKTLPDNEISVEILEDVHDCDVFVVQSIAKNPNYYLMELLLIVDALKRSRARSICAVIPYFGYARQDRRDKEGVPISAKLVADLLEKAGVNKIITINLHSAQIQGFFNIPVMELSASSLFLKEFQKLSLKTLVVGPDFGSYKIAKSFAKDLNLEYGLIDKKRIDERNVKVNTIFGNVLDKDIILVDDLSSTGDTLIKAADCCKKNGAKKIFACIVHALVDTNIFENEAFEKFYFTNSISNIEYTEFKNVEIISVGPLLAKAIRCFLDSKSALVLSKS